MSLIERIEQASGQLVIAAITAVGGAVIWVVRRVLTNQKQIEMMQREFDRRDEQRREDREALHDVKKDVKGMRSEIHQLFMRDK